MPHFMIVLILYINLLNFSWIKKTTKNCLFFEEYEAFKSRYTEDTIFPALIAMFCFRNLVELLNREVIVFVPFKRHKISRKISFLIEHTHAHKILKKTQFILRGNSSLEIFSKSRQQAMRY